MSDSEMEKSTEEISPVQHELEDTIDNGSEFGDFDNEDSDDDFGDFDDNNDFEEEDRDSVNELPSDPMTLDEILVLWSTFVTKTYTFQPTESFTNNNSTKSIKFYVLEEATDSFHSRITWDSVTKYKDDDTGIPRVRWVNSEIEKLHLKALSCQRSATPISMAPTMLDISNTSETYTSSTVSIETTPEIMKSPTSITMDTMRSPTTSEKRSSIFGLSSLSRYLPHLSKSKLPSPTSPKAPTFNASSPNSPRIVVPNHNIVTSPPIISQQPAKEPSDLKRTTKDRARSTSSQSMDLLDLFDEDTIKPLNFMPLVPTASTSTPQQVRRYTMPANMHSEIKPPTTSAPVIDEDDDDFGDFTGDTSANAFDDIFSNSMIRSKTEPVIDFKLNMQHSPASNDPYDRASYFQKSTSAVASSTSYDTIPNNIVDDPLDLFFESKPLSQFVHKKQHSAKQELFDSFMTPPPTNEADDEDWGDWAF